MGKGWENYVADIYGFLTTHPKKLSQMTISTLLQRRDCLSTPICLLMAIPKILIVLFLKSINLVQKCGSILLLSESRCVIVIIIVTARIELIVCGDNVITFFHSKNLWCLVSPDLSVHGGITSAPL